MRNILVLVAMMGPLAEAWKNSYDGSYTYACPSGQVMYRIRSQHDNSAEDRVWEHYCKSFGTHTGCAWSGYINDWDAVLSYNCPNNQMLVGMGSYHDNWSEDRR